MILNHKINQIIHKVQIIHDFSEFIKPTSRKNIKFALDIQNFGNCKQ